MARNLTKHKERRRPVPGRVSMALRRVYDDLEVQQLVKSYSLDPRADTHHRLKDRAMKVMMTASKGHFSPEMAVAIIREEFSHMA